MSDTARLKCTIHISGLDPTITLPVLTQAFLPFGEIASIQIPTAADDTPADNSSPSTAAHRGFALIEYTTPSDALSAIDNMDQAVLLSRVLKVSAAKPLKERGEGLGSKVAVWEQEGWLAKYEVSEEDKDAARRAQEEASRRKREDAMLGLDGGAVAGPQRPE
ncbi:putative cyclophilin protein [Tirmania nivea]|nr:putative cyclophilin protein [Tirmania nivea]